jgi:hypothetical protein
VSKFFEEKVMRHAKSEEEWDEVSNKIPADDKALCKVLYETLRDEMKSHGGNQNSSYYLVSFLLHVPGLYDRLHEMFEKGYLIQQEALVYLSRLTQDVTDRQALSCVYHGLKGMVDSPPNVGAMTQVFQYNSLLVEAYLHERQKPKGDTMPWRPGAERVYLNGLAADVFVEHFVTSFKRFEGTIIPVGKSVMESRVIPFADCKGEDLPPPPLRVEDSVDTLWCPGVSEIDKSEAAYTAELRRAPETSTAASWTVRAMYIAYVESKGGRGNRVFARAFSHNANHIEPGGQLRLNTIKDANYVQIFYLLLKNKKTSIAGTQNIDE